MHLKSLTLRGFKSFASATTLKFEPGICAIVGPNGSGKSNIVDALRWVMGDQGAKNMRGGKMEDVIFAGGADRKPLGRAEVTLTFDNQDQHLPLEYTEVSVTRRMFRDGASEYEINGAKARLMDVQELLSDSGIGREMHIIVGQNKLGEILESRPEDRRAFIEEAAGVLKHRRRKEKAQRKLTGMQADLDRLQDLTDELAKQLTPLARQAEAAQRAATVQATLRVARLALAGDDLHRLHTGLQQAQRSVEVLAEQLEEVTAQAEEHAQAQLEVEEELAELAPQADAAQQLFFELSTLAERVSATTRIATERATTAGADTEYRGQDPDELLQRAQRAEEEEAQLTQAAEEAAERLENIREQVAEHQETFDQAEAEHMAQVRALADRREGVVRLLAQQESLLSRIAAAEEESERSEETLTEGTERVRHAQQQAKTAEEEVARLASEREPVAEAHERAAAESRAAEERLDELRQHQREHDRRVFSLQARIETLRESAPRAAVDLGEHWLPAADLLRARDGWEKALAVALGRYAEAMAGEVSDDTVARLADATRTVLLDTSASDSHWRLDTQLPASASWLLDHMDVDERIAPAVNRLLADVAVTETLVDAQAAVAADPRIRAVTREGILLGEGWVEVGSGTVTAVEISAQVAAAEAELAQAEKELEELAGTLAGATQAAEDARVAAASATAKLQEHDSQVHTWERDLQRLRKQVEANQSEQERATSQAQQSEERLQHLREELNDVRDRLDRVEDNQAAEDISTEERDAANTALQQIRAMEMEATLAARQASDQVHHVAGRSDALRRQAEHERAAKARHDQAMQRRRQRAQVAEVVAKHSRDLSARVADALARATAARDEVQTRRAQAQARLAQVKSQVSAAQQHLNRVVDNHHAAHITLSQAQVRLDEAENKITEQLGIPAADVLRDHGPSPDFDRAATQAQLKQAEKDLRSLGKVNPLALEEYRALEERHSFLATQLADVMEARQDLSNVIDDVDEQILQLFTDAWRDVEAEFPRVFNTLFPGGEGRLVLTDPSDMLATGIDIEARPPGKKVKRLSLLSGGEKSLTALALLVAIFRARPSPFYVMDEVEAALDDVNLRRLIALFEEMRQDSQLIVITHQKPTMDIANVLYGVTMRDDGVTRVLSQRMNPATAAESSDASASSD